MEHQESAGAGMQGTPRSIGELLTSVFEQIPALIRGEIDYTIASAKAKGKEMGVGGAALAVAGVMALFGFIMLLCAAVAGIATVLPWWAAFLIVAGALLLIAGIAALVGKSRLSQSKKYTVDPKAGVDRSVEAVRKGFQK
ncbi:MAG: phage holin family protein [Actinomycetaceae bacterium]|nr:phage holin family protein [Actinomycetaceae bacterium]